MTENNPGVPVTDELARNAARNDLRDLVAASSVDLTEDGVGSPEENAGRIADQIVAAHAVRWEHDVNDAGVTVRRYVLRGAWEVDAEKYAAGNGSAGQSSVGAVFDDPPAPAYTLTEVMGGEQEATAPETPLTWLEQAVARIRQEIAADVVDQIVRRVNALDAMGLHGQVLRRDVVEALTEVAAAHQVGVL